ncbi:hypothetical protein ACGF07_25675 [Kitasatospora sp. NPDC048194]|uniref:hypothetical protein n=1 Tax=Kitasatospora sp. NPDC048194 TaxID=3364045 RepID=UPI003720DD1C
MSTQPATELLDLAAIQAPCPVSACRAGVRARDLHAHLSIAHFAHEVASVAASLLARVRELEAAIAAVLALEPATDEELERMDPEAYQQTTGRDDAIADIKQMLSAAPSGPTRPETPTLTGWAADMADAGLEPYDGTLTLDADDKPYLRVHLAFSPDATDRDREGFTTQLGHLILREL